MEKPQLIEATATILAVEGDMAVLETKRTSACSGCRAAAGCGTSTLGELFGRKQNLLRINNNFEAIPGEQVIIGLPESDLVLASLAAYMVPLGGMIGAALLMLALGFSDGVAGFAALAGLAGGLLMAGRMTKRANTRFTPRFLRRTPFEFASKSCGQ